MQDDSDEEEDEEEEQRRARQKKLKKSKLKKKKPVSEDEEKQEDEQETEDPDDNYNMNKSLHPIAVLFTITFKGVAAVMYLLGGTIFAESIVFISVVLLCSFDFWTVKNVTGRLLVGLRWWSDYNEEGDEVWRFESPSRQFQPNVVDKSFFWTSQFAITVFWTVFLILNILSLTVYWGILDLIGFTLSAVNLWGFYKCSKEHQDKLKNVRNNFIKKGLIKMIQRN